MPQRPSRSAAAKLFRDCVLRPQMTPIPVTTTRRIRTGAARRSRCPSATSLRYPPPCRARCGCSSLLHPGTLILNSFSSAKTMLTPSMESIPSSSKLLSMRDLRGVLTLGLRDDSQDALGQIVLLRLTAYVDSLSSRHKQVERRFQNDIPLRAAPAQSGEQLPPSALASGFSRVPRPSCRQMIAPSRT